MVDNSASVEEAVLKAKVAQICRHVGYHSITQDSSNILVDIYRRTLLHLARHCKDAANNNRRNQPTIVDLVQAYDFVGISIDDLKDYIHNTKLPLNIELTYDGERKPSNRIQRNFLVDDLLEAEKDNQLENQDDDENKAINDMKVENDERSILPLLKDTFEEISNKFANQAPVKADKSIRIGGRILTKLKISAPVPPEPIPSSSEKAPINVSQVIKKDKVIKEKATRKKREPMKETKASKKKESSKKKQKVAVRPLDPSIAEPPSFLPILEVKSEDTYNEDAQFPPSVPAIKENTKTATPPPVSAQISIPIPNTITLSMPIITTDPTIIAPSVSTTERASRSITVPDVHEKPSPKIIIPKVEETTRQPSPNVLKEKSSKSEKKKKKKSNNKFAIVTDTVVVKEEKEWLCPSCGGPDDGDLMVQCDTCQEWYHIRCTNLKKPPEDDENWECDKCSMKIKVQKKSIPKDAIVVAEAPIPIQKTKTPELVTSTPPPPRAALPGTTQDDLCPECNLPDDGTMMIQCEDPFCAKWFHGKCVNLLEEPKEDESWFCKVCVEKQQSAFKRRRRAK